MVDNPWVKEVSKEIKKKNVDANENGNTMYQNLSPWRLYDYLCRKSQGKKRQTYLLAVVSERSCDAK